MANATCHVTAHSPLSPEAIWPHVKDLRRPWHPLVEQEYWQLGSDGKIQTSFTTKGDDTLYVEQQTFISHSLHWLGYRLTAGIDGIDNYHAWLEVAPHAEAASQLMWQASVSGPEQLVEKVAQGSASILQIAVDSLAKLPETPTARSTPASNQEPISPLQLAGSPNLGLRTAGIKQHNPALLIFLHGIGGQASNWDLQLQHVGHYLPSVAMDLRGYGASDLGADATRLEDYFADILRLKAHFNADKLILCGLSYGAWIASSFASHHPQLMLGLIASGGCTGMSEAAQEERQAFLAARQAPLQQGLAPKDFAPAVVQMIAGQDASEQQKQQLFASMAAISSATYADALQCFCNPPEKIDFAALQCPMLFMTGDNDRLASPREITNLAKRVHELTLNDQGPSWVQLEILTHCGHVANLLQPQAYNRNLLEFIQRVLTR